jgi:hypothetical protein
MPARFSRRRCCLNSPPFLPLSRQPLRSGRRGPHRDHGLRFGSGRIGIARSPRRVRRSYPGSPRGVGPVSFLWVRYGPKRFYPSLHTRREIPAMLTRLQSLVVQAADLAAQKTGISVSCLRLVEEHTDNDFSGTCPREAVYRTLGFAFFNWGECAS